MSFLQLLASHRVAFLDTFFSYLTYLGAETAFMALALLFFWCINKRTGYYIFFVGFMGTIINQYLKLRFRIPRPWVLDPNFQIVEAAREGASGYSFPSGHTQNAVGTFGVIALSTKKQRARILCVILIILVPFSRMYLGVHTPLDVGVSFLIAIALLAIIRPAFVNDDQWERSMAILFASLVAMICAYLIYILYTTFPADIDQDNLMEGTKNAYIMLGCGLGLIISYFYDLKYLKFDTSAPLLGQILKLVLGLGLLIAIRMVLKTPLLALFHGSEAASAVRYCIMVLFAGCIWPHTFPFFAKLGKKS